MRKHWSNFIFSVALGFLLVALPLGREVQAQGNGASQEGEYMVLRLKSLPTASDRAQLEAHGIYLVEHVEGTSYWARVLPRAEAKLKAAPVDADGNVTLSLGGKTRGGQGELRITPSTQSLDAKISPQAQRGEIPDYAIAGVEKAKVVVYYRAQTPEARLATALAQHGVEVKTRSEELRFVAGTMPTSAMRSLAEQPFIAKVEYAAPLPSLFNVEGRAQIGPATLSVEGARGLGYGLDGEGVTVTVIDGNVVPHRELVRQRITELQSMMPDEHGQHVAGTVGASGDFMPAAKGMAPKVHMVTLNFRNRDYKIADYMIRSHDQYNSVLSQNSYGMYIRNPRNGVDFCNNRTSSRYIFYSEALDRVPLQRPSYALIYAAGNDQTACGWAMSDRYQTSSRVEKNIITVAAIDSIGGMTDYSSWGPLMDGRMVPLISANGYHVYSTVYNNQYKTMNGTSMACPGVSGLTALLYQHYRNQNLNSDPTFVLIKSVLLNTATEAGRKGPDYCFGYGIADGVRSAKVLTARQYREEDLSQGAEKTFEVDVPAGLEKAKFMIVWNDAPGFQYRQGVNLKDDLDMEVRDASGRTHRPWVLDPNSPSSPATRGAEHRNNHEQVQIDHPQAGKYTVTVRGHQVASASVHFALSWDMVEGQAAVRYPNGGEVLSLGRTHAVRWYPGTATGAATLEISTNGGASYSELAQVDDITKGLQLVEFPVSIGASSEAKIRIKHGGQEDESDKTFTLSPLMKPRFAADPCSQNGELSWETAEGVREYEVLRWDEAQGRFLHVQDVQGNKANISETPGPVYYYAVRAKFADGVYGERSTPLRVVFVQQKKAALPIQIDPRDPQGQLSWSFGSNVMPTEFRYRFTVQGTVTDRAIYRQFDPTGEDYIGKPSNQSFIGMGATCVDARDITTGNLSLSIPLTVYNNTSHRREAGSRVVVRVDGEQEWKPLSDGDDISSVSSGERVFSLKDYLGKKFAIGIQLLAVQPVTGVSIGTIEIDNGKSADVGVANLKVPANGDLKSYERITFDVLNRTKKTQEIPVVVTVNGQEVYNQRVRVYSMGARSETVTVDLSKENTEYKIEVQAKSSIDTNPDNNVVKASVYNLAPYFCMPQVTMGVKEVTVFDKILFADDGGALLDYSPDFEGAVRFNPTYRMKTKLTLKTLNIADGAELTILREGKRGKFKPIAHFKGGATLAAPKTFAGTLDKGATGALQVLFSAHTNTTDKGWTAEVESIAASEHVGEDDMNTITLKKVEVLEPGNELLSKDATVQITVVNHTKAPIANASVSYEADSENRQTESLDFKVGEHTYILRHKLNLRKAPMRHTVSVFLTVDDPIEDDNSLSQEVWTDRYVVTEFQKQSPAAFILESLGVGAKTYGVLTKDAVFPNYQRYTKVRYVTSKDSKILLNTVNSYTDEKVYAFLWVDTNRDGVLSSSERKGLFELTTPSHSGSGKEKNAIEVTMGTISAGEYNMRIALSTDSDLSMEKADHAADLGVVYDFTLNVLDVFNPADIVTLSIQPSTHGSIKVQRSHLFLDDGAELEPEEVLTITAHPQASYMLQTLDVVGADKIAEGQYTVKKTVKKVTVSATFVKKPKQKFHITYSKTGNGTIEVLANGTKLNSADTEVEEGSSIRVTATPAQTDYEARATVNGIKVNLPYEILSVDQNYNIRVAFVKKGSVDPGAMHMISFSNSGLGRLRVLANGRQLFFSQKVPNGTPLTIQAEGIYGYKPMVLVNNPEVTVPYEIPSVDRDYNIVATYVKDGGATPGKKQRIYYTVGANGALEVQLDGKPVRNGGEAPDGSDITIIAKPNPGFVPRLSINQQNKTMENNIYVLSHISKMTFINVFFLPEDIVKPTPTEYTLTCTKTAGGQLDIYVNGSKWHNNEKVKRGSTLRIEALPEKDYEVNLKVNGVHESVPFTVASVEQDYNIEASFTKKSVGPSPNPNQILLTYQQEPNGTLSVLRNGHPLAPNASLAVGDQLMIKAVPDSDYTLESLTVNGASHDNNTVYTVASKDKGVNVEARFILDYGPKKPVLLTVTQPNGGKITVWRNNIEIGTGTELKPNDMLIVSVDPQKNYELETLRVDGAFDRGNSTYEVEPQAKAVEVSAILKREFTVTFSSNTEGTVIVKANGTEISSGTAVAEGSTIRIEAQPKKGYVAKLMVNTKETALTDGVYEIPSLEQDLRVEVNFVQDGSIVIVNPVELTGKRSYTLYPNPTTGMLQIGGLDAAAHVRIFTCAGLLVRAQTVGADGQIDLSRLAAGAYILRVNGVAMRFVKM